MRILVISDIHANLAALQAVLKAAAGQWDALWCLGDVVGYGPDPNECVELLRTHDPLTLTGNHDQAALGHINTTDFNPDARMSVEWTNRSLKPENRAWLETLPPLLVQGEFTLAHASPREPMWEYITDTVTAWENFSRFDTSWCLVGHSHYPVIFAEDTHLGAVGYMADYSTPFALDPAQRLIINPGSVGQPRDTDPRAAYGLLDLEKRQWEHRRVAYDIHATQARMAANGFSQRLISRLQYGW
jgi:diadenosine tetraphosphatase ApaH/serine/threonine PP2A family protein phosphatase